MLILPALILCAQQSLTLYVSPTGRDTNNGSSLAPFQTIARAVNIVNGRSSTSIPATIVLEKGDYLLSQQITLATSDSNLTIKGQPGVRVLGATVLKSWSALGSDSYASNFPASAQANILVANLNTQISASALTALESANSVFSMDVLEDGQPLALAQYPAPGTWLTTSGGTSGSTLAWTDPTAGSWTQLSQIWMSGYPSSDSSYATAPLSNFNASAMTATLANSVTAIPGCRFAFANVPNELNGPGQYFFNRSTGKLYFWPLTTSFKELAISTCPGPLFNVGGNNVSITNITMQGSLSNAVLAHQANLVAIQNCTVNGITGNPALDFSTCTNSEVNNCTISNSGATAISMSGGNITTFTASGNLISNCTISNFARLNRGTACVDLYGDGNIVTHNLIENGPFDAIDPTGPNNQITYNLIENVDYEVSDTGAIHQGRDPIARGLTVVNNWFQNVNLTFTPNSNTAAQVAMVYLDDMLPGALVEGNIFQNGNKSVLVGGGRDNSVLYNVFLGDTVYGIQIDDRGLTWAHQYCTYGGSWHYLDSLQTELQNDPYFLQNFPLASDALTNQPYFPVRFNGSDNVYVGTTFIMYQGSVNSGNTNCVNNVLLSSGTLQQAIAALPSGYTFPPLSSIGPQH